MIVTAALVWYNEKPKDLEACVRGMANIADRVVAVDGAYRRYPRARISSPPSQAEVIRKTAAEVGLKCDVVVPDRLWAGQVEKRSFTLKRAAAGGTDWIAVVDADWIIHGNRDAARSRLKRYGPHIDVVSVPIFTPASSRPPASGWHVRMSGNRHDIPHFFRNLPGLRVENRHWHYSAIKNGKRVWMWHGRRDKDRIVLKPRRLGTRYEIEHRTLLRDKAYILDSRAFLNDRAMVMELTGQEDDVPGLPPPEWDYETVQDY